MPVNIYFFSYTAMVAETRRHISPCSFTKGAMCNTRYQ